MHRNVGDAGGIVKFFVESTTCSSALDVLADEFWGVKMFCGDLPKASRLTYARWIGGRGIPAGILD